MKTLLEMLRELGRPDVAELAMASDRLPCLKVDGKYQPVDDDPRSTESILEMLVAAGGSRYVDTLETRPEAWTMRVDGLGSVGVQAVMRDGRVQTRFVLVRRASNPAIPAPGKRAAPPPEPDPTPAAVAAAPPQPARKPPEPAPNSPARPDWLSGKSSPPPVQAFSGLDALLGSARSERASDLHLVAGRPIALRVGGELLPRGEAIAAAVVEGMLGPVVPERLRSVLDEQGSCDFALERGGVGRFRVNVSRQRTGLKACFRLIAPGVPTLASLGLPPEIEKATHHHQGLVIVTGPTGHGKTSTLAAIVDIVNRETTHHVITVEDPVEFIHPRKKAMVSQREVGTHTQSFAAALKASLREDPDVIVVGELRDTETVRMALAASETGHLVLGTMNTPSAAKTIDRLVDLFPSADQAQVRMTLSGGLHLIVSQRLLPTADGSGMVAAVELLPGSIALWSLIRDNKTFQIPSLQQRGKGFGIMRLDESLYDLVKAGRITRDVALSMAELPEDLADIFAGKRPPPGAIAVAPLKPDTPGGLLGKAGQLFGKRGA